MFVNIHPDETRYTHFSPPEHEMWVPGQLILGTGFHTFKRACP
jgi:hypothetical protein